jgi:hypothetical protein
MVVLDSTFLLMLIHEGVSVPKDPKTSKPWEKGRERVEYLIDRLSDAETPVLVTTPVLSETLVRSGTATGLYLSKIRAIKGFRIGNFDERAAVELALLTDSALKTGSKRGKGDQIQPWQKVKIDRQIIAIAKVEQATELYSSDRALRALAAREGLTAYDIGDLPLPPVKAQADMFDKDGKPVSKKD